MNALSLDPKNRAANKPLLYLSNDPSQAYNSKMNADTQSAQQTVSVLPSAFDSFTSTPTGRFKRIRQSSYRGKINMLPAFSWSRLAISFRMLLLSLFKQSTVERSARITIRSMC